METNSKDLEFIKRDFEAIIEYEKTNKTPILSATKILEYFGAEYICKIHGCSIISDRVALAIINEVLKK